MLKNLFFLSTAWAGCVLADVTVPYPGKEPGKAGEIIGCQGKESAMDFRANKLENSVLSFEMLPAPEGADSFPRSFSFLNREIGGEAVQTELPSCSVSLESGSGVKSYSSFDKDEAREISVDDEGGASVSLSGRNEEAGVALTCRADLKDGAHYVKLHYTIKALRDVKLVGFAPIRLKGRGFSIPGEVPGTPLVHEASRTFYGVEQPVAEAKIQEDGASIGFECSLPMKAGDEYAFTAVAGVYPEGQLRRGFLAYLEKERANPYHQFLHYNCWYDHGLNPTEENMLATVKAYGEELVRKRGIKLDSFVLDDGWDDYHADLWRPHPRKFPNGFGALSQAVRDIDSHFGIWISPLGGYSGDKERTEHARRMGLIPANQQQLDLSCPGYYNWFLARCKELMEKDGVNFFKWDRAGGGVSPHFMALLRIASELRKANPDVFLSTTVGTWPSPFWLNYVDCIWRTGSSDVNWIGEGNSREQYITYRDAACYRLIVKRAPLFPLNSLMHHGVVLGKEFQGRRTSDARIYSEGKAQEPKEGDGDFMADATVHSVDFPVNNDLRKDTRIFFASGVNLQELYLSPDMMNERAWDDVAEAARWARRYQDVLADVHWVGGDPEKGEIYGYAAWRGGRGATLVLRNPSGKKQKIDVSLGEFFNPTPGNEVMEVRSPYADQRIQKIVQELSGSGSSASRQARSALEMEPFEVLVFCARFDEGLQRDEKQMEKSK